MEVSDITDQEINYFDLNCKDVKGTIKILISSNIDGLLTYGVNESDTEGSVVYDGLEVHFIADSTSILLIDCMIVFAFVLIAAAAILIARRGLSYEKIFLISYILVGIIFFFIMPPLAECDAANHMRRIMAFLQGHAVGVLSEDNQIGATISWPLDWGDSDSISLSMYQVLHELDFHLGSYNEQFLTYTNVALYSPFSYLPSIIGALLGRIVTTRLVFIVLAARLINYVCTGLLMYMAVKLSPYGKKYICMIALLPMFMQQAVGVAPDAMLVALITLLTAIVINLRYTDRMVDAKYLTALYVITFLIGQYKIVYVLFCLMAFAIPYDKFGSKRRFAMHASIMGCIVAVTSLVWLKISSGILSNGYTLADIQTHKMLTRFDEYVVAIFRTVFTNGSELIAQVLGLRMGAFAIETNHLILAFLLTLFIVAIVRSKARSDRYDRLVTALFTICIIGTVFLIFTAEFIQWNDGINIINGVQGRYFIPFLFPLFILIGGKESEVDNSDIRAKYFFIQGMILLCFIPQIIMTYIYMAA